VGQSDGQVFIPGQTHQATTSQCTV